MANVKTQEQVPVATLEQVDDGIRSKITMDETVVATIAGLAAQEIKGIHSLGKSRLISFGTNPSRGVAAEVGEKQAALDLEVVINYGCDIRKVCSQLREEIAEKVKLMAGRDVVEVNVHVVDIKLPDEQPAKIDEKPRVI